MGYALANVAQRFLLPPSPSMPLGSCNKLREDFPPPSEKDALRLNFLAKAERLEQCDQDDLPRSDQRTASVVAPKNLRRLGKRTVTSSCGCGVNRTAYYALHLVIR